MQKSTCLSSSPFKRKYICPRDKHLVRKMKVFQLKTLSHNIDLIPPDSFSPTIYEKKLFPEIFFKFWIYSCLLPYSNLK